MYTPTQNYGFKKPAQGDLAKISVLNDNMDLLDELLMYTENQGTLPFDASETVNAGAIRRFNHVTYRCKVDGTTGPWDASKWDATDLGSEIENAGESGASALSDLDDVEITNPSTGQALLFDDDDDVWKNQDLPDVSVTKEASGNPIEITDGANAPLVKCVTAITGSQDLHGYDKPWVGGAGKNKLPNNTTDGTYTSNGLTIVVNNGVYSISGTSTSAVSITIPLATSVDLSPSTNKIAFLNDAVFSVEVHFVRNETTIHYWAMSSVNRVASGWTDSGNEVIDSIKIIAPSGITLNMTLSPMLVRLTESNPTTFEPYSNICPITAYTEGEIEVSDGDGNVTTHTTTYPSAIYRGSEDVVNGTVGANSDGEMWVKEVFDGSSDEQWFFSVNAGSRQQNIAYINFPDIATSQTPIANLFEGLSNRSYNDLNQWQCASPVAVGYEKNMNFVVDKTLITSISDWRAWLSNNNLEVVYKLATPTTSSVTPTNLPVKSLSGYTHIESSTGDMEVEYITEGYQPLVDLIDEAADTKHAYSTTEHVVGKWIDGKDVYEKTYSITLSSLPIDWTALETIGIDTLISYETQYVVSNGQVSGCDGEVRIAYNPPNETGKLCYYFTNSSIVSFIATVRYTKTSSNNRSLSLSKGSTDSLKADLSEVKDEGEEILKDDEKAIKIDESESKETDVKEEETDNED